MRLAVAILVVAAGCSGGVRQLGAQPSWRSSAGDSHGRAAPAAPVLTFAPTSEPARSYNEPVEAPPHTPLGDATLAALHAAASDAHLPTPVADGRLFRACGQLAQVVPEEGVVGNEFLSFALQRNGIVEPLSHLIVVWGDVDAPQEFVDQLRPKLAEMLADSPTARIGVGALKRNADGTGAIVFAMLSSGVATSPIPRALPKGGTAPIDAVLDGRFKDPEVFVTREDGSVAQLALALGRSGGFKAAIACGAHVGRQQIEISATAATGGTELAIFPVWCGVDPPSSLTITPTSDDGDVASASAAEQRLFALANRDRAAAGLPPLVWDDRVAAVARAYSEEMRRTNVVAHISPISGAPDDRVRAGKIKTAVVLENVARAYSVGEAHAGLMNSPAHRANLLSRSATHLGIGVALGDHVSASSHELFVTQVFIRIPPKIDPQSVAEQVHQKIDHVRAVHIDSELAASAQQLASGLAAGKSRDSLWSGAKKQLDELGSRYARVGSVITAVVDTDTIDGASLIGDYKPDSIGVGIAQGTHPELGDGAVWIVVLMGERNSASTTNH